MKKRTEIDFDMSKLKGSVVNGTKLVMTLDESGVKRPVITGVTDQGEEFVLDATDVRSYRIK